MRTKKIAVVLPAYNAEKTLRRTYNDIPKAWADEIILVDDASSDGTVALSKSLGIHTIAHKKNLGYGGNQKTCYHTALERDIDIVVMVHPDHQYDPADIPILVQPILEGSADAVFGSRMAIRAHALAGGMPRWKFLGNILLTAIENKVLGLTLTEYHSGFRAYSRDTLTTIPYRQNRNDFVFDTEMIVWMKIYKFRIKEIPIRTSYFPEASMIGLGASIIYAFGILQVMYAYLRGKYTIPSTYR